jgi:hypothetical protein
MSVSPDDLYTYESRGLFFVNGRGAAHDADVLVEPFVQMPFSYPSRVLFECKAYDSNVKLPVVRNALGLKIDINEFEIVTKDSLEKRKNNRRAEYAIETRQRYNYQVGVACVDDFTKPAIEFAANNKIFLLSLSWFLDQITISTFHSINQQYIDAIDESIISKIYDFLKDRHPRAQHFDKHGEVLTHLINDIKIGRVIHDFDRLINRLFVGIIESGDLVFFIAQEDSDAVYFADLQGATGLKGKINYNPNLADLWLLSISRESQHDNPATFKFFVPPMIMDLWGQYNLDREKAVEIKRQYFSRIFMFNHGTKPEFPFFIVNIDKEWLDSLRQRQRDIDSTASGN